MEESGLLRVEPKEPTEVPAVLTLVKKDCEGEAWRRELEEELDELVREEPVQEELGEQLEELVAYLEERNR